MSPGAALLFPVVRGLITATLLLLTGLQITEGIVARRVTGHDAAVDAELRGWLSRLPGLLAWFLLMLVLGRGALEVLSFVDPGERATPELIRGVLWHGAWGDAWVLQCSAALALLAGSWLLMGRDRLRRPVSLLLVAVLLWSQSGMGHPADQIWGSSLGRVVDFTHLVGGGYWLGTLGILALAVMPALRTPPRLPLLAAVVRDFSLPARLGATLLLLSGASATWRYAGSVSALIHSIWGQLLLAKLTCLLGVVAIGWWNWKVVTPQLEAAAPIAPTQLRRAVMIELALGAVMLAITAVLVALPLPHHPG
ncbi:MAG: CopD family protein [Gemmatimonadota bacterium]